eukprot:353939-Chlamydomonas_euryale.AAC.35
MRRRDRAARRVFHVPRAPRHASAQELQPEHPGGLQGRARGAVRQREVDRRAAAGALLRPRLGRRAAGRWVGVEPPHSQARAGVHMCWYGGGFVQMRVRGESERSHLPACGPQVWTSASWTSSGFVPTPASSAKSPRSSRRQSLRTSSWAARTPARRCAVLRASSFLAAARGRKKSEGRAWRRNAPPAVFNRRVAALHLLPSIALPLARTAPGRRHLTAACRRWRRAVHGWPCVSAWQCPSA